MLDDPAGQSVPLRVALSSSPSAPVPQPIRVLIVEDREDDYRYVSMLLLRSKLPGAAYEIGWAPSYEEGRRAVMSRQYDVGLFDYQLGGYTGLDLLRSVQREGCEMPIILLTGYDSVEIDHEASQAGAADYLCKVDLNTVQLERAIRYARRRALMLSELRRSNNLLNNVLATLPALAGRINGEGVVIETQGTDLAGGDIRSDRLLGKIFTDVFPQSRAFVEAALRGEPANFSIHGGPAEDNWFIDVFVSREGAVGDGATFFARDVTARRRLEQQLLTVSDAEQQRIGADLHDGLGQQLTGLACMAAALREKLQSTQPAEAPQADLIAKLANDAVEQSRALARGLSPVQLEQHGLISALEDLTYQSQLLHRVECRFLAKGKPPRPNHIAAIHLYRITQEAIHNAVRHGEARRIEVSLISTAAGNRLIVEDDGRGFDPKKSRQVSSRGLRLMGFRANIIGGILSVKSQPGKGARIECFFGNLTPESNANEN